jgi:hypothetical protein
MKNKEHKEYQRHVAALIMAKLVHKSVSGSDFSSDLQMWDSPARLADIARECAAHLADRYFDWEEE